jgi:hypothetical protein
MKIQNPLTNALVVINFFVFFAEYAIAKETVLLSQRIEKIKGEVFFYDDLKNSFLPAVKGMKIEKPTLFQTSENGEIIFSCIGKISARVSANARVLLSPGINGRYEVELRKGTITASLDPNRPEGSPIFAIRTFAGVTEATGTLFAVTEYQGQSYTAVKNGTIKKKTQPPTKPDFSAYLKKAKPKTKPTPSSKK